MTYADAIAKRLLTICERENITVNKLCTLSGVSHTTIQDIITGKPVCKSEDPEMLQKDLNPKQDEDESSCKFCF